MSNLIALAGVGKTVTIRGHDITVIGISARGISVLLSRFPSLLEAMNGKGLDGAALMKLGPDIVAALIAWGTGTPNDEAAEAAADSLDMNTQLALLEAIISETFAGDMPGFIKRLTGLAAGAGVEVGQEIAAE
ncbi:MULTISPECIES: hypothetical protein [unclassified Yoonia]|uniref:phage pre-tape measure protein n=1 Tax=unclassified Yoonia TaxID=2629118 RepID=UPI002B002A8C|nr:MULTISPECIES: hypothetical protein [unclassified Yoonia]